MSPQIEVIVSPSGETRVSTRGFVGPTCKEATKALEVALGQRLTEKLTTEYHSCSVEEAHSTERYDAHR